MTKENLVIYNAEYEELTSIIYKPADAEYEQRLAEVQKLNNVCPECGNTDTINRFAQVKGDFNINASSHSFRYGYSYGDSSASANINTLRVRECKSCGNQWETVKNPEQADYRYSTLCRFADRLEIIHEGKRNLDSLVQNKETAQEQIDSAKDDLAKNIESIEIDYTKYHVEVLGRICSMASNRWYYRGLGYEDLAYLGCQYIEPPKENSKEAVEEVMTGTKPKWWMRIVYHLIHLFD